MVYYHADRVKSMTEGKLINLSKDFLLQNQNYNFIFENLFPDGVSKHGERYLKDSVYTFEHPFNYAEIYLSNQLCSISITEYVFELIRRLYFPNALSRMTSLFAFPKLDDLNSWEAYTFQDSSIFEITTTEEYPIYDANFLLGGLCLSKPEEKIYQGFSPRLNFENAFNYWSGKFSSKPKLEVLLPLPLTIGKRIK